MSHIQDEDGDIIQMPTTTYVHDDDGDVVKMPQVVHDDDGDVIAVPQETADAFDFDNFFNSMGSMEGSFVDIEPTPTTAQGQAQGYSSFAVKTQQAKYDSNQTFSFKGTAMQTDEKTMAVSEHCKEQRNVLHMMMDKNEKQAQIEQIKGFLPILKAQRNDIAATMNALPDGSDEDNAKLTRQLEAIERQYNEAQDQLNKLAQM